MIAGSFKAPFSHYANILTKNNFLVCFKNSFLITAASLVVVLFVGALASYALANWRGKFSRAVYLFIAVGMLAPIQIASVRITEIIKAVGLQNKLWGLLPIYVAMGVPIAVFILTEFIKEIPFELTEAALIDGAGRWTIFWRIIAPLLRPALAIVAVYNLVPFWNNFWFPLILINDDRQQTVMLAVMRLFAQDQADPPRALAVLTLAGLPVLILYLIASKQFIKSMTAAAVKG
jgi:raffinose/stachyose/melibiose transport system permease protein